MTYELTTPADLLAVKAALGMAEQVSVLDYYAAAVDAGDYTAAMDRAEAYLATLGGGTILLPIVQEWPMNWTLTTPNIWVEMVGGRAEYDINCIRPFALTSPAITIGNGTTEVRYCGLRRCHVSGTNGTVGADTQVAKSAAQAVLVKGGAIFFTTEACGFYNGVQTLALVPSATLPVTGYRDFGSVLRNDLADSSSARTIYASRLADPGYFTDNKLYGTKVNGPALGYAGEFDGTAASLLVAFFGSYWDVKPDHGLYLKGSVSVVCQDLQLDPGAAGVVVIETNQTNKDPARYLFGHASVGGQKMKFGDASTITFPTDAGHFAYQGRYSQSFLNDLVYITPQSDPYRTTTYFDYQTDAGPLRWNGTDLKVTNTTDATAADTGALRTLGGLSVSKAGWFGTTLSVASNLFAVDATGRVDGAQAVFTGNCRVGTSAAFLWSNSISLVAVNTSTMRLADIGSNSVDFAVGASNALSVNGAFTAAGYLKSGSYTVATVPSPVTAGPGAHIYVSNEAGGAVAADSDGTDWRRTTDRAIIS